MCVTESNFFSMKKKMQFLNTKLQAGCHVLRTCSCRSKCIPAEVVKKLGNKVYRIKVNDSIKDVHGAHLKKRIERKVTFDITDFDLFKNKIQEEKELNCIKMMFRRGVKVDRGVKVKRTSFYAPTFNV